MRICFAKWLVLAAYVAIFLTHPSPAVAAQLRVTSPTQTTGTLRLAGNASGYLNVEAHSDGVLLARVTPPESGDFVLAIDTRRLKTGKTKLVIDAWNSPAGQPFTLTQRIQVNISVDAPSTDPQLLVTGPKNDTIVTGPVYVAGNARGFLNVEVSYAGAVLGRATPAASGDFSIAISTAGLASGARRLLVDAWNSPAGQPFTLHQQLSRSLRVQPTSPAPPGSPAAPLSPLTVAEPASGTQVSGAITVAGSAPGFHNIEIYDNEMLLARTSTSSVGTFSATVSSLSLLDGAQTLTVRAWDAPAGLPFTRSAQEHLPVFVANDCVNVRSQGAVGDGHTDDYLPLTLSIAAAKSSGKSVCLPAGIYAYGKVLRLVGVKLFGVGDESALYALHADDESIFLYGSGAEVRQLRLTGVRAPARMAKWEATRITLFGATDFVIDHVTIEGSSAAGIQTASGTNHGIISHNSVSNTLADAIHITDNASYITVEGNHISGAGDDGIAVVSYASDAGASNHITAENNVVLDNAGGRAMSVVGGRNIIYRNNLLQSDRAAACLYLAQEGSWNTWGVEAVTAESNSMIDCGNARIGHGAVMIITTGGGHNSNITLRQNEIAQDGDSGVRVFGANENIVLTANYVVGAKPAYDIEDSGVSVIPYTGGSVGYEAGLATPIP